MSLLRAIGRKTRQYGPASVGRRQASGNRYTIPAPTKGWNTRDGFGNMKPEYAIVLDNYFPDRGAVRLRRGFKEHASGVGTGDVRTLFNQVTGATERLWAAGGGSIYNVTTSGSPGTEAKSGLMGNAWHEGAFGGSVILVNGVDEPLRIQADGTFADAHNWAPKEGQPDLTVSNLSRVIPFKGRLYFVEKNSANLWHSDLGAIQGDLTRFPLNQVHPRGGNIVDIGTLTLDGGTGIDDLMVLFMSSGAAIIYQGTNPTESGEWSIVGIFELGRLLGDRPLVRYGGDLVVMTEDGYIPLSRMLLGDASRKEAFSDTIAPSVSEAADTYGATAGWDCILFPKAKWLLFNVPQTGGVQHVMNTQTKAWARFRGMNARSWAEHKNRIFFGGTDGKVYEAHRGSDDNGQAIDADSQGAFNYLKSPDDKRFTMMRALVEADGGTRFRLGTTTDFGQAAVLSPPTDIVSAGSGWNEAQWNEAEWAGGSAVVRDWQAINRDGTALSVRLRSRTKGVSLAHYATDVIAEKTVGILG